MDFRGITFDFKPTRASDAERMENAEKTLGKSWSALNVEKLGAGAAILEMCNLYDDYFCDILGDDYADKLGVDTEDLDEMMPLFSEFQQTAKAFADDMVAKAMASLPKKAEQPMNNAVPMPQNREQRRAARRNHKH
nr:MAG TPA: hypothetical protein [Caudoviricetes sp.]